ncbi:MAG: hypothetical protein M3380_12975, partial [Chloroflexota bacterium]|nr:hypothetical protein [Chloroflexota bacterium]
RTRATKIFGPYGTKSLGEGGVVMKRALGTAAMVWVMAALATAGLASAEVVTNEQRPINFQYPNPCSGETVSFSGVIHVVSRWLIVTFGDAF